MDTDSNTTALIRSASLILAALIVLSSSLLVWAGKLDGKDLIALVGQALGLAGAGRMMTFPTATATTKETDPTTGKITERKTQQPLGMPPPVAPAPAPPQTGAQP